MASSTNPSRERIKSACLELELAIADFENDEEAERRAQAEAEKLRALKNQLLEIRRQLDLLS
jgi:hypothetical protein